MAVSHVKSDSIIDATGTVTVWWGTSTLTAAATDLVLPSDWNSGHNQFYTLSGNTNNASTASGTNVVWSARGEVTLFGSTATIGISGRPPISSFANAPIFINTSAIVLNGTSDSHAVQFQLPSPGSFSFIRIPALMTTNSTTIATSNASRNVSGALYSTWNAVVYSMGSGANSRSLQFVASGQGLFTHMNSLSISGAGTQYSVTQGFSYPVEGVATSLTTQYSISNTNYSLASASFSDFSSVRFIDIPFANSLAAGAYWLVFGMSSSLSTNSAGAWSNAYGGRYSNHYVMSAHTLAALVMGSTNNALNGFGAGSFSTAGGGTTNSIPVSAISSFASNVVPYFQMLRSA